METRFLTFVVIVKLLVLVVLANGRSWDPRWKSVIRIRPQLLRQSPSNNNDNNHVRPPLQPRSAAIHPLRIPRDSNDELERESKVHFYLFSNPKDPQEMHELKVDMKVPKEQSLFQNAAGDFSDRAWKLTPSFSIKFYEGESGKRREFGSTGPNNCCIKAHNEVRAAHNLPPLHYNSQLEQAASAHNKLMAKKNCLQHECPGEPNLESRILDTGYPLFASPGENIAQASGCDDAMKYWVNSKGHLENILGNFTHLACYGEDAFITCDFANPREPKHVTLGLNKNSLKSLPWTPNATQTKVIIHGYLQDLHSGFPQNVKNAYLRRMRKTGEKWNVIVVDWGLLSKEEVFGVPIYALTIRNVPVVAKAVGKLLKRLIQDDLISDSKQIHIVGQSLGAHISGQTGNWIQQHMNQTVGRISGEHVKVASCPSAPN